MNLEDTQCVIATLQKLPECGFIAPTDVLVNRLKRLYRARQWACFHNADKGLA